MLDVEPLLLLCFWQDTPVSCCITQEISSSLVTVAMPWLDGWCGTGGAGRGARPQRGQPAAGAAQRGQHALHRAPAHAANRPDTGAALPRQNGDARSCRRGYAKRGGAPVGAVRMRTCASEGIASGPRRSRKGAHGASRQCHSTTTRCCMRSVQPQPAPAEPFIDPLRLPQAIGETSLLPRPGHDRRLPYVDPQRSRDREERAVQARRSRPPLKRGAVAPKHPHRQAGARPRCPAGQARRLAPNCDAAGAGGEGVCACLHGSGCAHDVCAKGNEEADGARPTGSGAGGGQGGQQRDSRGAAGLQRAGQDHALHVARPRHRRHDRRALARPPARPPAPAPAPPPVTRPNPSPGCTSTSKYCCRRLSAVCLVCRCSTPPCG